MVEIIIAVVALAIGGGIGYAIFRYVLKGQYQEVMDKARKDAEVVKEKKLLEVKEKFLNKKSELEKEVQQRNQRIQQSENRLKQRELNLNQRQEEISRRRQDVEQQQQRLDNEKKMLQVRHQELDKMQEQEREKLEELSGLSAEEAKTRLVESMKDQARLDAASYVNEIVDEAKLNANQQAKKIVIQTIQRVATETAIENSVSVFHIENDEVKGRIIGREGRNIRALEAACGVEIVVDDQVGPGQCLQGADVAALAADDASLHLVIGQGNHTDGDLGHMVGGAALDGGGHDLPGPAVSLVLGPGLDLLDLQGSLVGHLGLHLGDQVILGLVGSKAGNALQHLGLAALDDLDLLVFLVGGGVLGSQRLLLLLDGVHLVIEVFFLLLQAALLLLQVGAPLLHFLLVLAAGLQNLFLGFKKCFSLFVFRALDGFVDDAGGFFLRTGDLFFRHALAIANTEEEKHHGGHGKGGRCYDPTGRCHGWCSSYSFLCMETDGSVLGQIITGRIPCPPDDNLT